MLREKGHSLQCNFFWEFWRTKHSLSCNDLIKTSINANSGCISSAVNVHVYQECSGKIMVKFSIPTTLFDKSTVQVLNGSILSRSNIVVFHDPVGVWLAC